MRANAVAITQGGRKALKSARAAAERAERMFLEALPPPERPRLVKLLATIAAASESLDDEASLRGRRKPQRRLRN
jgi:hypothetical protein